MTAPFPAVPPPVILAWAGAVVAAWRLARRPADPAPIAGRLPSVSILIPARNEAVNLPPLLASLKAADYPDFEIIVVDDNSVDGTADIAKEFAARVIAGKPLPPGWTGKNWACHQAAQEARGELLLFTDADTIHRPDGLRRAVGFLEASGADLISALPYHRCPAIWERWMGPFHALLLVATAHQNRPRPGRLFAIGQFLLFRRDAYQRMGGHKAVAAQYPDDLALANHMLTSGGRYAFHAGRPYFDVRMYATFDSFLDGWRRNIAAGLRQGNWTGAVEVTFVVIALLAGGQPSIGAPVLVPAAVTALLIAYRQKAWGEFSLTGAILYPFALASYALATALAVFDLARGGRLKWKDRTLTGWHGKP